jgi:hypothetical protein
VAFDPYHQWLGIPKDKRPPTHYQILGIAPDERSHYVIRGAAERQRQYVLSFEHGIYRAKADEVLGAIADAEVVLLDEIRRREYDAKLSILHSQQKKNWDRLTSQKFRIAGRRVHPVVAYLWMPFRVILQLFELNTKPDAPRSESVFSIPSGVMLVLALGLLLMVGSLWLPWKKYIHQDNDATTNPTTEAGIARFVFKVQPEDLILDTTGMWATIRGKGKERIIEVDDADGSSKIAISASSPGYLTWTRILSPQPGERTVIEVQLTRQVTPTEGNEQQRLGDGSIPDFFKIDEEYPMREAESVANELSDQRIERVNSLKPVDTPSFFDDDGLSDNENQGQNRDNIKKNSDKSSMDFFQDN